MSHAYMYHGGFEANYPLIQPGAKTMRGTDGADHALPAWPAEATGVRVGYMEKPGKHFVAVRVVFNRTDLVLKNEVLIDPIVHLGAGKRFSAEPTVVGNAPIRALLDDAIRKNPERRPELEAIRNQVPPA
ncbi:MAG TPA: hypothetical protein VHE78_01915 [Gemmatimonadaceae bacterium]|nr:hypothetical protein [Gemmatimonadaceae bacterium]